MRLTDMLTQLSTLPLWTSLAREAPLTVLSIITTLAIIQLLRPIALKWLDWEGRKEVERIRNTPPGSMPAISSLGGSKRRTPKRTPPPSDATN